MSNIHYLKKGLIVILLLGMSQVLFAREVEDPDSSNIKLPPRVSPRFLLAQGMVSSNPSGNASALITPVVVTSHCPADTNPQLKTSLSSTYENQFYASGGIINNLKLSNYGKGYTIKGSIYMINMGATGNNVYSPITMNWQIWCLAKTT